MSSSPRRPRGSAPTRSSSAWTWRPTTRSVLDPATLARVEKDRQDGLALGVQGTPTFFLNGKQVTAQTEQQFRAEIDAALAGR